MNDDVGGDVDENLQIFFDSCLNGKSFFSEKGLKNVTIKDWAN